MTPRFWNLKTDQPDPANEMDVIFNWWGHKMISFKIKLGESSPIYYDNYFVKECIMLAKNQNLAVLRACLRSRRDYIMKKNGI